MDRHPQRDALARTRDVSLQLHAAALADIRLEQTRQHLLEAQTSCHFYWGDTWVDRCHNHLDQAIATLTIT